MTLEELARRAGVSTATVSNALSGKGAMTDRTRERIAALADELGYQPQAAARALATGRRNTIGFVTGSTNLPEDPWTTKVLGGMVCALEERGYHLMLFHAEPREGVMPAPVLQNAVDGLAVGLMGSSAFVEEIMARGMPVVVVNPMADCACDSVRFDDVGAAKLAACHLIETGHRRVAFVPSYSPNVAGANRLRWQGYAEAMAGAGLPVAEGGEQIQDVGERLAELFRDDGPTALVCFSDETALRAIRELRARGLAVPDDVCTVSIDDMDLMWTVVPSLTTVRLPFVEMGRRAAELILQRIGVPQALVREEVLQGELIVRDSSKPSKGD